MNPRNFPFYDPGDTGGSLASSGMSGQQYDAPTESNSDPGNWLNNAGKAWLKYRFTDHDPDPSQGITNLADLVEHQNSPEYQDWQRRNIMNMLPGTSQIAGPVRPVVNSYLFKGVGDAAPVRVANTKLEYYKPENPDKVLGFLEYSKRAGEAPYFENIESNTPRGTGELFEALKKRLGPMLNDLELSNILPNAVPFWTKLAKSRRFPENAPDLRQRILDNASATSKEYGSLVPKNSYSSNPLKTGKWIHHDMEPEASWGITETQTPFDELIDRFLARR